MITRALVLMIALVGTVSAHGELLLNGITMSEGQPLFSLYSTEDQTSKWIRLGQSFAEFKATGFDAVSDTLTVQKGEARRNLKLQSSTITVSTEDRKTLLIGQQNTVGKELSALSAQLVKLQSAQLAAARSERSEPKIAEELATVAKRRTELESTARELDRVLTELSRAAPASPSPAR